MRLGVLKNAGKSKVTLKQRSAKDLSNDAYAIFFLIFFIKAYVVGILI